MFIILGYHPFTLIFGEQEFRFFQRATFNNIYKQNACIGFFDDEFRDH